MLKNYLKTAIRSLWKHKLFSLINVFGLALGLTVTILILQYVQAERSYDQFPEKRDEIYRVLRVSDISNTGYSIGVTSGPYGPTLLNDYPETVKDFVRVLPNNGLISYENRAFIEGKIYFSDANFFEFFSYPLANGDPATALAEPNTIVLTQEMAKKYFGETDPIGKVVRMDNRYDFTVTGVMAEKPGRSHLDFDFMASIKIFEQTNWFSNWWSNGSMTYLRIETPAAAENLEAQLPAFMEKYFGEDFKRTGSRVGATLQPLAEVYFQKDVRYDFALHGDKNAVYIFFAVAVFILLIACINYMNLTTARASRRAREIGVRKVLGAFRSRLVMQFLAESFMMTLAAILLAIAAVELLLPAFNSTFHLDLEIDFTSWNIIAMLGALLLLVSLLAGSYPAFLLSSFKPIKVLKSRAERNFQDILIRKGLVVFQFCISVFLIIATLIIGKQLDFVQSKDLGFNKDQVILTKIVTRELSQKRDVIASRMRAEPEVLSVTFASGEPGGFHDAMSHDLEGIDEPLRMRTLHTDYDYVKTFGLEIIAGRDFSRDFGTDSARAVILNETAVRVIGWTPETAIGKTLSNTMIDSTQKEIVGVVKDYHFSSLKHEIEPLIISMRPWTWTMGIKVQTSDMQRTLAILEGHWREVAPEYPFEFTFLDEAYGKLYQQEQRESTLFTLFAGISILIACLGIFALAAFAAEERTKEIGIRKVLGASMQNIITLLSGDFIKLVLIGNIIAWPMVWFAMNSWLENFAYRIEIGGWVFFLASGITLLIALATVSYQAVKSALKNPVTALRYE